MDRGRATQFALVVPLRASAVLLAALLAGASALSAGAAAPRRAFVPVLTYHHVKWDKPGDDAIELGLTIHPPQFQSELAYLASHHYHPVSALRLVRYLRGSGHLPSHAVVLSFDDGYADMYTNVYPQLRQRHMTATFFICPGLLGKPRYLTWHQVIEMASHGMDIEAHTVTHPDLTLVPAAQTWGEIYQSQRMLRAKLHRSIRVMAYPYGDYNRLTLRDVRKAGYWAAFTTHQGWWQQANRLLTLPRVYVDRDDSIRIFAGRLRADPAVLAQDPT